MKKIVWLFFGVVIMIFALFLNYDYCYASDACLLISDINSDSIDCIDKSVVEIENILKDQGTSVEKELINVRLKLLTDLENTPKESPDYEKIKNLLCIVENDLLLYEEKVPAVMANANGSRGLIDDGVVTIGAWFLANDYLLAWELLMHSRDNSNPYSIYYPLYGDRVLVSPFVIQARQGLHGVSGSSSFENIGSTLQRDLYYAIHAYDYTYSSNTHRLTIYDVYDYEPELYDGIAHTAINIMYLAQLTGVITPYNVRIIV